MPQQTHWTPERAYPRFEVDRRLTLKTFRPGQEQTFHGHARTISEGGLGALIADSLEPGETVGVLMRSGDGGMKLEARAIVKYRTGFHHGLEFVGLSPAQRDVIRAMCSEAN